MTLTYLVTLYDAKRQIESALRILAGTNVAYHNGAIETLNLIGDIMARNCPWFDGDCGRNIAVSDVGYVFVGLGGGICRVLFMLMEPLN